MQHGALFRGIDLFALEHGIDAASQVRLLRELQKRFQSLVGDTVLGIVEEQSNGFSRHALAALGIVCEELAQVQLRYRLVVSGERLPCRALSKWLLGQRLSLSSHGGVLSSPHSLIFDARPVESASIGLRQNFSRRDH